MDRVSQTPLLSGWMSFSLFLAGVIAYDRLARALFNREVAVQSAGYFSTEKKLSFLAVVFFTAILFLCDPKYYLSWLSLNGKVPALTNIAGLGLFLLFFMLMWRAARVSYQKVFGREYTTTRFLLANIKANLPIVLPWIVLSLLNDMVAFLPWPALQSVIRSEWGDLLFFGMFLLFVLLFFPPLVRRLWGCKTLPESALRSRLVAFCKKQHFSAEIYLWPLFEGRVLTAGIMGVVPGLRYILITPALIETMSEEELEAVMAHEIGHVKRMHLLLYFLLIGGFSFVIGNFSEPAISFFLSRDFFYTLINKTNVYPDTLITIFGVVPFLAVMLFYFRYIFGYFLRNFERQADIHVFPILGNSRALISAFEKISIMSGDIRDQPSWHHFGIGERVDYLLKCEKDPSWIGRHNRKVYLSLLCYVLVCVLGVVMIKHVPMDQLTKKSQEMYTTALILEKVKKEPNKALWLRLAGDMMVNKKMEIQALAAYRQALAMEPVNPEIMNNLAWLFLTSEDLGLRDPLRALTLARSAAIIQPKKGFVLDTLATAYWANGFVEEAIAAEHQAVSADPGERQYYLRQIAKFSSQSYKNAINMSEFGNADADREEGRPVEGKQ